MKFFKKSLPGIVIATFIFTVSSNIYNTQEVFAANAGMTISVTGNSSVTYKPNMAQINVGVITTNEEVNQAQNENNLATNDLINKLTEFGLDVNDISTSSYYVYPLNYFNSYLENDAEIHGYTVENSLLITIRNLDHIGDILDIAIGNGANSIHGITFSNSNEESYYLEALQNSIIDATNKANAISNTIGYELGDKIYITEETSPNFHTNLNRATTLTYDNLSGTVPIIAPNDLTISASVNLVFEY